MPEPGSITVIIPSYNRAATLPRALQSVFNQTHPANQVIVVDDGSTDATAAMVKQQFPQTRYIYQPNRGVSAARNKGIQVALQTDSQRANNKNWIALLDSDDEWLPEKLEQQLSAWQRQPQNRLIHCDEIWIRNGRRVNAKHKHRKYGGHIFHHCLPLCAISPSAVLLQYSLLTETGLFDESLPACEDYDLWLRICHRESILFVDQPLLNKYGGHTDQLSQQHWGMDRFRVQALQHCIDHEALSTTQRHAAIAMLQRKLDILIAGARKRKKTSAVDNYQRIKDRYPCASDTYSNKTDNTRCALAAPTGTQP